MPDGGAAWFLSRQLGRHRAAEIIFSGRYLDAEEALAAGRRTASEIVLPPIFPDEDDQIMTLYLEGEDIPEKMIRLVEKLIEKIEEDEDVTNVFHNMVVE